jgi:TolA-binding protein
MIKRTLRSEMASLVAIALIWSIPVAAQTPTGQLDLRVGKLEKEMRAVQRSVFPQGVPVQPDLGATPAPPTSTGAPASAPLVDLTVRVDGLERQLATLTGASEQNGFRIKQLEDALARVQARLTAIESGGAAASAGASGTSGAASALPTASVGGPAPATRPAAVPTVVRAATPKPAPAPVIKPTAAKLDPARKAAVAAIEIPATGDAAEDDYSYGFRLYTAKFYPEAQAKLKEFTTKYPVTHRRWSYAQNLLGRAYLDEGKPALASVAFYDNYQKAPRGDRAADSLASLGQALVRLKKLPDACKVFDELKDVYGAKLTADQQARAAKGRTDAKCSA